MPARELQQQLNELREQLEAGTPLSAEEQEHLQDLIKQIELQLDLEAATPDTGLVDGVNLAVERFEVDHPTLAATLRNIVQSLANMGI
ncbi:DUF4404 family protein [Zestomonas carbonaria]|uniref:Chromosome partitioning protein ParA n=1 Tax=Zestomonas carbonaria TaxID=2762745 RepID=A0A7U7IBI0_9GAMM|nr:DUF4404 family protein [Pseudomonas carbonaria]CAD5110291.1 hypothetical protein PSEWESI4_04610 [Pseudomonas carbonaria]